MFKKLISLFKGKEEVEESELEKNEKLHTKLKKEWDNARMSAGLKTIELQPIYYSPGGSIYYSHTNVLDMTVERRIYLGKAMKGLEFGVGKKYMESYDRKLEKYLGSGDVERAKQLHQDFKIRRGSLPEQKLILEVALCMFYRHNENPYNYNHLTQLEKLKDIEEDANLRAFFIDAAWETTVEAVGEEKLAALKIRNSQDFLTYLLTQALRSR